MVQRRGGNNGCKPSFTVVKNNGSSWITTGYYGINFFTQSGGGFSTNNSANASSLQISQNMATATNYSTSGEMLLTNIGASQTLYPSCYGRSTYLNTTAPQIGTSMTGGSVNTAGCNAFQLFFSSVNIASGTFELYAVL